MRLLYSTSKALDKWLKADLPSLEGPQKGRNPIFSDECTLSWQLHIVDNRYRSFEKTIIATEAFSRFTCFLPVLMPNSDAVFLLSKLDSLPFEIQWRKNTDLSINGHITDAALWVTDTLRDRGLDVLPYELSEELSMYLNSQVKRSNQRRETFVPLERFLAYCQKAVQH
ncbi:amino acid adenylation [Thalassotalea sp. Y01]|uniref:amino acid adenylation n=1 Tax=Thalassotalea sp. Y01 TaxID=2729613 RepID=UPI00145F8FE6|nr:amino acid adenylation [Thalassotalea sp. Y01]NMP16113.1 amino acid adenylation [Thalassotalea sp. Y01]